MIVRRATRGIERLLSPVVHHLDEDESNDDPSNLAVMHHGCHVDFHSRLIRARGEWNPGARGPMPKETRQKISVALTGRKISEEVRERMRGRVTSVETRRKLSEIKQGERPLNYDGFQRGSNRKFRCGSCDKVTTAGPLKIHQNRSGHTGKEEILRP